MIKAVDVTKQHEHTDLILKCEGDERVLFVSSYLLRMSCKFFLDLFRDQAVDREHQVSFNYHRLKKVMQLVHASPVVGIKLDENTDTDELIKLFQTAYELGCPLVMEVTLKVLEGRKNVPTAWALIEILHCGVEVKNTLMKILEKLSERDLLMALQVANTTTSFAKKDLLMIAQAQGYVFERVGSVPHEAHHIINVSPLESNGSLEVRAPWEHSDVVINTEGCAGKRLYSNQKILSPASKYFKKLFKNTASVRTATGQRIVNVPTSYTNMKLILYVVHDLTTKEYMLFYLSKHPHLRRDLWVSAEKLQFDRVKEYVAASFSHKPNWVQLMDTYKLGLESSFKVDLIQKISPLEVIHWMQRSCKKPHCEGKGVYCFATNGDQKLPTFCPGTTDEAVMNVIEFREYLHKLKFYHLNADNLYI